MVLPECMPTESSDSASHERIFVNPRQRCGHSDLPFARTHYFNTAGSRKGLRAMATPRDMEVVIKSAASAASRKTKSRAPRIKGSAPSGRCPLVEPWTGFGPPADFARSRLDHGFHIPSHSHGPQPLSGPCKNNEKCNSSAIEDSDFIFLSGNQTAMPG